MRLPRTLVDVVLGIAAIALLLAGVNSWLLVEERQERIASTDEVLCSIARAKDEQSVAFLALARISPPERRVRIVEAVTASDQLVEPLRERCSIPPRSEGG